jgi:hypothetical protein
MVARRKHRWSRHVHMEAGAMSGWCAECPADKRHRAIQSVVREDGYGTTIRRLNFLRNVANRRRNRGLEETAARDLRWAQRTFRNHRKKA